LDVQDRVLDRVTINNFQYGEGIQVCERRIQWPVSMSFLCKVAKPAHPSIIN
ncbi:hypothetical protein BAE44_0001348, partial [Dichanthelium oligosanthes]